MNFVEDNSVCYVPSSWLQSEVITRPDGQQREISHCYWPADAKNDEQIRSWIRNCSQPNTEAWSLLRCKCKGVFHSTDAALKALKQLEGTDSTTDSDTMSQPNSSTGQQSIGEKADVRSGKHHSICQVDPAVMKQLLRIGAESKFNLIALLNDCSVPYVYKVKYLGIFAVTLSNVGRF